MARVFDCFTFFNELDLLEIRLETLDSCVDFFVIAESPITYRADSKPLYFEENKQRFAKFLPKIRHIIVDDLPIEKGFDQNWQRETLQRAALERGLADLDETMPNILKSKKFEHLIAGFDAEVVA